MPLSCEQRKCFNDNDADNASTTNDHVSIERRRNVARTKQHHHAHNTQVKDSSTEFYRHLFSCSLPNGKYLPIYFQNECKLCAHLKSTTAHRIALCMAAIERNHLPLPPFNSIAVTV